MKRLQFDEFLRSISIGKNDSYTLLLGAGCSISSGIPSANDCIWDWKGSIYKSNNPSSKNWINNFRDPKVQRTIQTWIDKQNSFISKDDPNEYSYYAKKCFPIDRNRRQYFQQICSNRNPSIGYKTIPLLVKQGMLDSVWTTNFDDLVMNSCIFGGVQGIDISLDSVDRINQRTQNSNELPIIKLHGDFKYGDLKNTKDELQKQDSTFRSRLVEYLTDKNLIVIGYSGRDTSLMNALSEAYDKEGGGMLYWCGYHDNYNSEVENLINKANQKNRQAFFVPTDGFDSTLLNITKLLVANDNELVNELSQIQQTSKSNENFTPFKLNTNRVNKVLKSNCYPLKLPDEVLVFDSKIKESPWKTVKELTKENSAISAIPYKGKIWAFGTVQSIKEVFGNYIVGDISRKPITDAKIHHSGLNFLMLSTICKLLVSSNQLNTNFENKIWGNEYQTILGTKVFEAIKLSIEKIRGSYYLSLNPSFYIVSREIPKEKIQAIGLNYYHKIWNNKYNTVVDKWRKRLFNQDKLEFPIDSGSGFIFSISKAPIFTNICDLNNSSSRQHNVPDSLIRLEGLQFKESELTFSTNHGGNLVSDTHPMRGLINNKPYETNLNTFLSDTIQLGVIAPARDSDEFYNFLCKQNQEIKRHNSNDGYLLDYKGFHNIYGLSLNIPEVSSQDWQPLNEPNGESLKNSIAALRRSICDRINAISSSGTNKVIVIYIPTRWNELTSYNNEGESFDLHDYIKAYCVEKRITSQIIREKTIKDKQQSCQINWWLSLSYYVKSLRTPWVLKSIDSTTAFAGIGYSVNSKEDGKGHIVLGCSHIYSSTGEGLKYKLSKIDNERIQWRHKKPHLSYDDAYEFGKSVINLFYESMNTIPRRVVIHKRTFYTEEEKRGILDSLLDNNDIESVDLIEINYENDIKYVSSKIREGKTEIDGFSVSRGTCIKLSSSQALLWAHGVIPSVINPRYNFYPGGRYIPKPLKIIKHHGEGSLEQIANEILGLTKMNWNSLNMYSQLPATISSSNDIARIGKLIENSSKIEYDYRYFI